ncbi:MAG TPA: acyltransferase [Bacteroidia bacterium]|nr:acyltransferase [Bacteroidia bacterium]HNU32673.1 acyltransferase [Bacteroidia bacterium]
MSSGNQKDYFESLTGLRYIAALFVFIHHFTPKWLPISLYDFLQEFHIGVTIFFVLSGFLICYRYSDSASLKKNWLKNYFVNRVARIYPMYFLITIIPIAVYKEGATILFLNLTFLRGFFQDFIFTGVWQGWSLTVEECFYILAPLIFLFRKKLNIWLMCTGIILFGAAITAFFNDIDWHGFMGEYKFFWSFTFFGRCAEFFAGVQLALWLKKNPIMQKETYFTYIGFAGILLVAFIISLFKGIHRWGIVSYEGIFLNNFILPALVCTLIYGLICEKNMVSKFLAAPFLKLLGKSSYCFYLIHLGVLHKLINTHVSENFFVELAITTCLSIILFKYLEEPLNTYLRKTKIIGLLK